MSEAISATMLKRIVTVMHDHRLTPAEKCAGSVIFALIFDRLCSSGIETVAISIKEISIAVGLSERKVRFACGRLVELEYLRVHEHRGRANTYELLRIAETETIGIAGQEQHERSARPLYRRNASAAPRVEFSTMTSVVYNGLPEAIRTAFEGRPYLTLAELAPVLRMSSKTLRRHANAGDIRGHQIGLGNKRRRRVFTLADVAAARFLAQETPCQSSSRPARPSTSTTFKGEVVGFSARPTSVRRKPPCD